MESSLFVLYLFFLARVYTSAFDDGVNSDHPSELSTCTEIPTEENAEVSTQTLKSSYTKGDSLVFNCQPGYVGRVSFICDGYNWKKTRNAKCSRKRCALPEDIPNGRFILVNGTEFVYGTTIKYICNKGYQMASFIDNRTCLAAGWNNHLPLCEEITCSPPVAKENIIVDGLPDNDDLLRYGHQLQFTCKSGFKLVGQKDITCGENGVWNHPSPICEGFRA
ncbi:complement factor H-like isoform X2 [Tachysurus fulvidraco]|uniref:complement factor H-like isoform X2 n=1 Tax=Tachysurus fulvidraco TaxID=1234273 RepID=UPI001FF0283D|nr:complement factor H-like isoform X2 [Tachysurus fulvidraco]